MRRHLLLYPCFLFLLALPFVTRGQVYYYVPYTTSTANIPNNSITVTGFNLYTMGTHCNLANGYWMSVSQASPAPDPSGFQYSFTAPVSHVRIRLVALDPGEFVGVKLNGQPYALSYSEVTMIDPSLNLTCNNQTADSIENGLLTTYSVTSSSGRSAQIDINPPFQINTLEVFQTQFTVGSGSTVYHLYVVNDTCGMNTLTVAPATACEGQSLTLSASNVPTGVTGYTWTKGSTVISTTSTAVIPNATQADAGQYTLIATRGNCNYGAFGNAKIKANPIVTTVSSSPAAPCPGQNISLNAVADSAGSTYSWTGPNNFTSTLQNPTVTNTSFLSQGTYNVTATKNGCVSAPNTTTVTLAPSGVTPTASNGGPACPSQSVQLYASAVPDPNATYQWFGPNNFTTTTKDPVITNVTYANAGKYYVVSVSNGCQSLPDSTTVVVTVLAQTPQADSAIVVCPGTPLNLTASTIPGATYSWTGPIFPSPSPVQNPSVPNANANFAGKYFVTATVNGCTSHADSTIVIVEITTPTPETDSVTIVCPATELKLSVDTIVSATYSWKGPGNYVSNLQNPTIPNATNVLAGKYYVRANIGGCISLPDSTVVVVEITTPTPETGSNTPVCEGTNLQLTASPIPNANYKWKGPNGFNSNAQNPALLTVAPTVSGRYIVEANVDGCISLPDTVTIDVKPAPSVSLQGDTVLCEQDTLHLTAISAQEPLAYQWTLPNGANFTEKYLVIPGVEGVATGKYTVFVNHDGCQSLVPGEINVRIKPLPAIPAASNNANPKDSARRIGQEIKLFGNNTTPGVKYVWSGPDGFTSEEQNPVLRNISKLNEGVYMLVTTLDGCSTVAQTEAFVSTLKSVVLYPNPNDGKFTLKASLGKDQQADLFIVNAVGQVVYKDKVEVKGKLLLKEFSLGANLSNGVYLLHIPLEGDDDIDLRFVITR